MDKEIMEALGDSKDFDVSANNDYVAEMLEGQLDSFIKNGKVKLSDDDFEEWVKEIQVLCAECYKRGWERALEDAEKSGLFIKLPCKVGDTVFGCFKGQIFSEVVTAFRFDLDGITIETDDDEYSADVFGTKLFLTRKKAEKRLEELKGE